MNIRVLIVDDETDFVETVVNRLKKRKVDATGVFSGEAAIGKLKEEAFDVVVLDVKMPGGMDGIETFREIRKIQPSAEIILLTGHASVETSAEGMEMGAFDYLMKPANFQELLKKIQGAFQRKKS